MCCSLAFWKRAVVFNLTLASGVFVVGLFNLIQLEAEKPTRCPIVERPLSPENKISGNKPLPETRNCIPMDGKLSYERLTATDEREMELDKQKNKRNPSKTEQKEQEKKIAEIDKKVKGALMKSAEYKDLLHREKCFETEEQK